LRQSSMARSQEPNHKHINTKFIFGVPRLLLLGFQDYLIEIRKSTWVENGKSYAW